MKRLLLIAEAAQHKLDCQIMHCWYCWWHLKVVNSPRLVHSKRCHNQMHWTYSFHVSTVVNRRQLEIITNYVWSTKNCDWKIFNDNVTIDDMWNWKFLYSYKLYEINWIKFNLIVIFLTQPLTCAFSAFRLPNFPLLKIRLSGLFCFTFLKFHLLLLSTNFTIHYHFMLLYYKPLINSLHTILGF